MKNQTPIDTRPQVREQPPLQFRPAKKRAALRCLNQKRDEMEDLKNLRRLLGRITESEGDD